MEEDMNEGQTQKGKKVFLRMFGFIYLIFKSIWGLLSLLAVYLPKC